MYPLFLELAGRRAVVVGGGCVATRRVRGLLDAGAAVDVIAPSVTEELRALAEAGRIAWQRRPYRQGDLSSPEPAWVAHTATGDREADALVAWEAAAARVWCVNAGDHRRSSAWTPSVVRGGGAAEGITVALTAGGDPRRAVALRDAIAVSLTDGRLPTAPHRSDRGLNLVTPQA